MAGYTQLEVPIKVTGPSGSISWVGHGWLGVMLDCVCGTGTTALTTLSSVNAAFGIAPGDCVKLFNTSVAADQLLGNSFIQPWTLGTAPVVTALSVRPATAVADQPLIGIALTGTPIRTAATLVRDVLTVAGVGSIVTGNCAVAAIGLGDHLGGTAASGAMTLVTTAAMVAGATGPGKTVGVCVRTNVATADGMGVTNQVGLVVAPW